MGPCIEGGEISSCENPAIPWGAGIKKDIVPCPKLEGIEPARKIRYWGHYPVADMEFETDAPVTISMRSWFPLIPGDTLASNTPTAVFEVHLQNNSSDDHHGTLVFNFPGPDAQESRGGEFTRRRICEDYEGILICPQGDDAVLREFYESAKRCNTFTMGLSEGDAGVISLADIGGMEAFEMGEWAGMASHVGFIRLSSLRIMKRMAEAMGDNDYAEQCQGWLDGGTKAMEEELWADRYYLNFYDKRTGQKSDAVMGYQLDGQWIAWVHGDGELVRTDRINTALETIKRCNVALVPEYGAATFTQPDGSAMPADSKVAEYGTHSVFSPELIILAMTYIYADQKDFGLELALKNWQSTVLKHRHPWDLPNMVNGETGERILGTEYYQNMILWAMPAALAHQDLAGPCRKAGLINRIIKAAAGKKDHPTSL